MDTHEMTMSRRLLPTVAFRGVCRCGRWETEWVHAAGLLHGSYAQHMEREEGPSASRAE